MKSRKIKTAKILEAVTHTHTHTHTHLYLCILKNRNRNCVYGRGIISKKENKKDKMSYKKVGRLFVMCDTS